VDVFIEDFVDAEDHPDVQQDKGTKVVVTLKKD
jgi:hypothetical protein